MHFSSSDGQRRHHRMGPLSSPRCTAHKRAESAGGLSLRGGPKGGGDAAEITPGNALTSSEGGEGAPC